MTLLLVVCGAICGAIVGSFLATLCVRWPRGEQVATGRSKCDGCSRPLGPVELVPLFSAAITGGACRSCSAPIDPLHWRVEAAAAVAGAAAFALSPGASGAALAIFLWLLLPIALLDARHFWIPDRLSAILGAAGLVLGGVVFHASPSDRIVGGIVGFASLSLLSIGYRKMRGIEGLGAADPKLFAALGLWTGWQGLLPLLLVASLAGLLAAAVMRKSRLDRVAFGTLLCLGGVLSAAIAIQPVDRAAMKLQARISGWGDAPQNCWADCAFPKPDHATLGWEQHLAHSERRRIEASEVEPTYAEMRNS